MTKRGAGARLLLLLAAAAALVAAAAQNVDTLQANERTAVDFTAGGPAAAVGSPAPLDNVACACAGQAACPCAGGGRVEADVACPSGGCGGGGGGGGAGEMEPEIVEANVDNMRPTITVVRAKPAPKPKPAAPAKAELREPAGYGGIEWRDMSENERRLALAGRTENDETARHTEALKERLEKLQAHLAEAEDPRVTAAKKLADKEVARVREQLEDLKDQVARAEEAKAKSVSKAKQAVLEQEGKAEQAKKKAAAAKQREAETKAELKHKAEGRAKVAAKHAETKAKRALVYKRLRHERDESLDRARDLYKKYEASTKARERAEKAIRDGETATARAVRLLREHRDATARSEEERRKKMDAEQKQRVAAMNVKEAERKRLRAKIEAEEREAAEQRHKENKAEEEGRKQQAKILAAERAGNEAERKAAAAAAAKRREETGKARAEKERLLALASINEQKRKDMFKVAQANEGKSKADAQKARAAADQADTERRAKLAAARAAALGRDQASAAAAERAADEATRRAASADVQRRQAEESEKANEQDMKKKGEAEEKAGKVREERTKERLAAKRLDEEAEKARTRAEAAAKSQEREEKLRAEKHKAKVERERRLAQLEAEYRDAAGEATKALAAAEPLVTKASQLKEASDAAAKKAADADADDLLAYAALLAESAAAARALAKAAEPAAGAARTALVAAEAAVAKSHATKNDEYMDHAETLVRRATTAKNTADDLAAEASSSARSREAARAAAQDEADDKRSADQERADRAAKERAAEEAAAAAHAEAEAKARKAAEAAMDEAEDASKEAKEHLQDAQEAESRANNLGTSAAWLNAASRARLAVDEAKAALEIAEEAEEAADMLVKAAKAAGKAEATAEALRVKKEAAEAVTAAQRAVSVADDLRKASQDRHEKLLAAERAAAALEASNKKKAKAEQDSKAKAEQESKAEAAQKRAAEHKVKTALRAKLSTAHALVIESGFDEYGHGYRMPMISMHGDLCYLAGALANTQRGFTKKPLMFVLPQMCRPAGDMRFGARTVSGKPVPVEVGADGRVRWGVATVLDEALLLDGLVWPAASAAKKLRALNLKPAAQDRQPYAAAKGVQAPGVLLQDGVCVLTGALSPPGGKAHGDLGTVPAECRPAGVLTFRLWHADPKGFACVATLDGNGRLMADCPAQNQLWLSGLVWQAGDGGLAVHPMWQDVAGRRGLRVRVSRENALCVVSGTVQPAGAYRGSTIAQLPSACRPAYGKASFYLAGPQGAVFAVDLSAGGQLVWNADVNQAGGRALDSAAHTVSLTGVVIPALDAAGWETSLRAELDVEQRKAAAEEAAAEDAWTPTPLAPLDVEDAADGWRPYSRNFAMPQVARHGPFCVLSGGLEEASSTHNTTVARLPRECRPVMDRVVPLGTAPAAAGAYGMAAVVDHLTGEVLDRWGDSASFAGVFLDGTVVPAAGTGYHTLALADGFVAASRAAVPRVTEHHGLCVLGGTAVRTKAGAHVIATLPAQCRPEGGRLIFHGLTGEGTAFRVDVLPTGRVLLVNGAGDGARVPVTLDHVRFSAQAGEALKLPEGMSAFGQGYRPPSVHRFGHLCVVSGLVRFSDKNELARPSAPVELPKGCHPTGGARLAFFTGHNQQVNALVVDGSGRVTLRRATHKWFSLDGAWVLARPKAEAWMATQAKAVSELQRAEEAENEEASEGVALKSASDQVPPYGRGYKHPQVAALGSFCFVAGSFKVPKAGGAGTAVLAELPEACRPRAGYGLGELRGPAAVAGGAAHVAVTGGKTLMAAWHEPRAAGLAAAGSLVVPLGTEFEPKAERDAMLHDMFEGVAFRPSGGDDSAVRVFRDRATCAVTGSVASPESDAKAGDALLHLPRFCRPSHPLTLLLALSSGGTVRADVFPDGEVVLHGAVPKKTSVLLSGLVLVTRPESPEPLPTLWKAAVQAEEEREEQEDEEDGNGQASKDARRADDANAVPESPTHLVRDRTLCALGGAVVTRGSNSSTLAVLPKGCRPTSKLVFAVAASAGPVRLDVFPDGRVQMATPHNGNAEWVSLGGVRLVVSAPSEWETKFNREQEQARLAEEKAKSDQVAEDAAKREVRELVPVNTRASLAVSASDDLVVAHSGASAQMAAAKGSADAKKSGTWRLVKGLAYGDRNDGTLYLSLRSRDLKGEGYLVYQAKTGKLEALENTGTDEFARAATFRVLPAPEGAPKGTFTLRPPTAPQGHVLQMAKSGSALVVAARPAAQAGADAAKRAAFKPVAARFTPGDEAKERAAIAAAKAAAAAKEAAAKRDAAKRQMARARTAVSGEPYVSLRVLSGSDPKKPLFVRHRDRRAFGHPRSPEQLYRRDATFQVVAPLVEGAGGADLLVTFRSSNYPREALALRDNGDVGIEVVARSSKQPERAAATWKVRPGFAGAPSGYVSLESVARPGFFMRRTSDDDGGAIVGQRQDKDDAEFAKAASFQFADAEWDPRLKLQSHWKPFAKGFAVPQYDRVGKMCMLSGTGYSGDIYSRVTYLPEECRPEYDLEFDTIVAGGRTAPTQVRARDGRVSHLRVGGERWDAKRGWRSLDGIQFPVRGTDMMPVQMNDNQWRARGKGRAPLSYVKVGPVCYLYGSLEHKGHWSNHLGTLAGECRPDRHLMVHANRGPRSARVDLYSNGQIHYQTQNGGRRDERRTISLDGVAFIPRGGTGLRLMPGFGHWGGSWTTPRFVRHGRVCALSGVVSGRRGSGTVLTLPRECRPSGRRIFWGNSHNYNNRVDVLPDGRVVKVASHNPHGWFFLDNIVFSTGTLDEVDDGFKPDRTPLRTARLGLRNGWHAHTDSATRPYRYPQVSRVGPFCLVSGVAVAGKNIKMPVAAVPSWCRPAGGRRIFNVASAGMSPVRVDMAGSWVRWSGGSSKAAWLPLDGVAYVASGTRLESVQYGSGYRAFGRGYQHPSIFRSEDGFCMLTGLVSRWDNRPVHGGTFVRVSPECEPRDGRLIFNVNHNDISWRVDVLKDGQVHFITGHRKYPWASLDGIAYYQSSSETPVHLKHGWYTYGYGYRRPSYRVARKLCALSGLVRGSSSPMITQLPGDCRPKRRVVFAVNNHQYQARLDVLPDGRVLYVDGGRRHGWVSLDGIKFAADGAADETPVHYEVAKVARSGDLELASRAVRVWGEGYAKPGFARYGPLCVLRGYVRANSIRRTLVKLPSDCRPDKTVPVAVALNGNRPARLDVRPDGTVRWAGGYTEGPFVPLDGIMFPVRGAKTGALRLERQFVPHDLFMEPRVTRVGDYCQVSGLVRTDNFRTQWWAHQLATMPGGCRPTDGRLIFAASHGEHAHRIDVLPSGYVHWDAGHVAHSWVSLSNIGFFTTSAQQPLPLSGSWHSYKHNYRHPSYRKQGNLCVLSGLAYVGPHQNRMATLPLECRPKERLAFTVSQHTYFGRVDVMPNGAVVFVNPRRHHWMPLDGVRFTVEAYSRPQQTMADREVRSAEGKALELLRGWKAYNRGFRNPVYTRVGPLCVLSGRASSSNLRAAMVRLPEDCRPARKLIFMSISGGAWNTVPVQLSVQPNGLVKWAGEQEGYDNHGNWLTLDGIAFLVASERGRAMPVAPYGLFMPYRHGYELPSVVEYKGVCMMQGAVQYRQHNHVPNSWLGIMPPKCRHQGGHIIMTGSNGAYVRRVDLRTNHHLRTDAGGGQSPLVNLDGGMWNTRTGKRLRMGNGQGYYGHGWRVPQVTRVDNMCVLSGLVRTHRIGTLAYLPRECWPRERLVFAANNHAHVQRVDVLPDGRVLRKWNVHHGWVSLAGIKFVVPATNPVPKSVVEGGPLRQSALQLVNGGRPYGGSYHVPVVQTMGQLCSLSGLARYPGADLRKQVALLPEECRPDGRLAFDLHTAGERTVRYDVTPDGRMSYVTGNPSGEWLPLDSVIFPRAGTPLGDVDLVYDWSNAGNNFTRAGWVVQDGLCVLTGFVQVDTGRYNEMTHHIANLPAPCRPRNGHIIAQINFNEYTHRINVAPNGVVHVHATGHGPWNAHHHYSLSGVAFPVDGLTPLKMSRGWGYYNHGYRQPSFRVVGDMCVLSGLANGNGAREIVRLPVVCRPKSRLVFAANQHQYSTRLDVLPDGRVYWVSGRRAHSWMSLDGIRFARAEGKWHKVGTNRCFNAREEGNAADGTFEVDGGSSGVTVKSWRLVHRSGKVSCAGPRHASNWGCSGGDFLGTFIADGRDISQYVAPTTATASYEDRRVPSRYSPSAWYRLNHGASRTNDKSLTFDYRTRGLEVKGKRSFRVVYGEVIRKFTLGDNWGRSCADVYAYW